MGPAEIMELVREYEYTSYFIGAMLFMLVLIGFLFVGIIQILRNAFRFDQDVERMTGERDDDD